MDGEPEELFCAPAESGCRPAVVSAAGGGATSGGRVVKVTAPRSTGAAAKSSTCQPSVTRPSSMRQRSMASNRMGRPAGSTPRSGPADVPVTVGRAAAQSPPRDDVFDGDPQVGDQDTEAVEGLVERLAAWCPLRMCPGSNPVTPASCATRHLGPGAGERGHRNLGPPGYLWDHLRERASDGRIPWGADHGARA